MEDQDQVQQDNELKASGAYEILQARLTKQGDLLRGKLSKLDAGRKATFGAIDTALIATERISTAHNCTPWDMMSFGEKFVFGYNVQFGLKQEILIEDVFALYRYENQAFHEEDITQLKDPRFVDDFKNLYKYYKDTQFVKFAKLGVYLYMVFRTGKTADDIKVFKWVIKNDQLEYIDARSDHELQYPSKYGFKWLKPEKAAFRDGKHPHISIEDHLFVETVNGDLTIKIEDNTEDGSGIYAEEVEFREQTLHDAEIQYSIIENIVVLDILPYREEKHRFLIFNRKTQQVNRIDQIEESCVLLPESHGLIFPKGFYLQTGEFKLFDHDCPEMTFEKMIPSPNGEDFLYVFYNKLSGVYLMLRYNTISRSVDTPIICHGMSIFDNGELCYFKTDSEPKKNHAIQIWQTPFTTADFEVSGDKESLLYKIGNKEIVRVMSDCNEILNLINRNEAYAELYFDVKKKTSDIIDAFYWLDNPDAFSLKEPLVGIQDTANSAIDEFEKVRQIKKNTASETKRVTKSAEDFFTKIRRHSAKNIDQFVLYISELRTLRGETVALRELRYSQAAPIDELDQRLQESYEQLTADCVTYLMRDDALEHYYKTVDEIKIQIDEVTKVIDADETEVRIKATGQELEMLIEVVSNLEIKDSTKTTQIIDSISTIFSTLNSVNAALKNKRISLLGTESKSEFNAQIKLVDQGTVNYLDVADTVEKCDEYLTKLMVQLEELEGKFAEFTEFVDQIQQKREEIYNAFDSKKIQLAEIKNKRITNLAQSAKRIVNAVKSRLERFNDIAEVNAYYASDIMIQKARKIVAELIELDATVEADDLESRLKSTREEASRQIKDKKDLFGEDGTTIKIGAQKFLVNTQKPGVSIIGKDGGLHFHITGTDFFEAIENEELNELLAYRDQVLPSENKDVSRAEYLAYSMFRDESLSNQELSILPEKDLLKKVQEFMAPRYEEGYIKGVHDHDATKLLEAAIRVHQSSGILSYVPEVRVLANYFWQYYIEEPVKKALKNRIVGASLLRQVFTNNTDSLRVIGAVKEQMLVFVADTGLFHEQLCEQAATYLFDQLSIGDSFAIDKKAQDFANAFLAYLKKTKKLELFEKANDELKTDLPNLYMQVISWVENYRLHEKKELKDKYIPEVAFIIATQKNGDAHATEATREIPALLSSHQNIEEGVYQFDFHEFIQRLDAYQSQVVPGFNSFQEIKKRLSGEFSDEIRLHEFQPRVMSSFVRNKLIDQVYFPMIGYNLAKQMGAAGEQKRTDLMGMLLLISPPGYGKTTLMEYVASRLGLIFMKINGPAIGHEVTSVDPERAPNASAKEELEKLNLSFEMGNNVMIYLDDIQHCNPEFLQKFISLCDGQRKIEGVYKGQSKTYDFRGKKVCVVMAGNPYTESGAKFQIPDMLTNRADIYNLGDILGDSEEVFKMSYVENSLTSNALLQPIASKGADDIYVLLNVVKTGSRDQLELKGNYSPQEVNDMIAMLEKMVVVRDVILKVNMAYIHSAGQEDDYRTEPPFKLQGSYRDMNKIVEKLVPMMNDSELQTLLMSHYESESQTLTKGAEANLLKFKEIFEVITPEEKQRLAEIRAMYVKNNKLKSLGSDQQMAAVLSSVEGISNGLQNINTSLSTSSNDELLKALKDVIERLGKG